MASQDEGISTKFLNCFSFRMLSPGIDEVVIISHLINAAQKF